MANGPQDLVQPNQYYQNTLRFIENAMLGFLQALFSTFPGVAGFSETEALDNQMPTYKYVIGDTVASEIAIEGQSTDNLETVDTRPKLVVARGPIRYQFAGINGGIGSAQIGRLSQRRARILNGTVGVSCYSSEELEADGLAVIVANAVEEFGPALKRFGFLTIHTSQIGQRAIIQKGARPGLSVTPVLISVQVTENWKLDWVDPIRLQKILLQLTVNPGGLTQSG